MKKENTNTTEKTSTNKQKKVTKKNNSTIKTEEKVTNKNNEEITKSVTKVDKVDNNINIQKDTKTKLIITVCAAIAAIIGMYLAYSNMYNSKKIFKISINKGYEKLERFIDDTTIDNKNNKPIMITNDMKLSMEMDEALADDQTKEMMEKLNKFKMTEKFGIDQNKDEMLFVFNYLFGDEDLFNIETYLKDKKMYLKLKNALDKYIEIPMDDNMKISKTKNISKDELKYLLSKTKDMLIDNMNTRDFKQSSETIKNGKKNIKFTKITYGLSEKSTTELIVNFYEDALKDEKYIKLLAKLADTKEDTIKKELTEYIKNIKKEIKENKLDKKVKVRFGILVKGITKKHVGYMFETIDGAKFIYYKNNDNVEIRLSKDNEDLISASKKDNKTVITLNSQGKETVITINKSQKDKKIIYDYEIEATSSRLSGKVIIEKIKENKDGTGETKITINVSMMGLINFKIEGTIKAEYVDNLDIPDISDSVEYEKLSQEELEKIGNNLFNNNVLSSLAGTVES